MCASLPVGPVRAGGWRTAMSGAFLCGLAFSSSSEYHRDGVIIIVVISRSHNVHQTLTFK
jgi:hypothetical protein